MNPEKTRFSTPRMAAVFASQRPAQNVDSGLFITYRQPDGSWKDPRPIDLGMRAGLPVVSPDGKYLFFTAGERGKSDIYWVDARILKKPRLEAGAKAAPKTAGAAASKAPSGATARRSMKPPDAVRS